MSLAVLTSALFKGVGVNVLRSAITGQPLRSAITGQYLTSARAS